MNTKPFINLTNLGQGNIIQYRSFNLGERISIIEESLCPDYWTGVIKKVSQKPPVQHGDLPASDVGFSIEVYPHVDIFSFIQELAQLFGDYGIVTHYAYLDESLSEPHVIRGVKYNPQR